MPAYQEQETMMQPNGKVYDVVIIGSGGAGLRAAIGVAQNGMKTLIVSKGKLTRSGCTLLAGSNVSADIGIDGKSMSELGISDCNKDDSKQAWFEDTLHQGFYLNNEELARLFVDTACDRVKELIDWGIEIRGLEGDREISVYGTDILDTLYKKLSEYDVDILQDTVLTDVVVENGSVKGVILFDVINGELSYVPAKAVILATGGAQNIFGDNDGPTDNCGESQAAALRAGAELVDMEMISYCPTIMIYPSIYRGNMLPYVLKGCGAATLRNKFGCTFTDKYLGKNAERLALESEWDKMLLSYAIQMEINNGGATMHDGVFMALNNTPANVREELCNALPALTKGIYVDIMKLFDNGRGICVAPMAHYFDGGIRIDKDTSTSIRGLFAAGECTGGLFGSNRVSAATTEMLIEGAKAGESAAEYASQTSFIAASSALCEALIEGAKAPFHNKNGFSTVELIKELHNIVNESLSVIRNEEKLADALEKIEALKQKLFNVSLNDRSKQYNREWLEYLQLRSMVIVAGATIKSALLRRESRGVHIREDYMYTDNDNFLKNIIIENDKLEYRLEDAKNSMAADEKGRIPYAEYIERIVDRLSE